ncbi:hypothetical protein COOONC_16026 [Cooperia oncophora]
MTQRLFLPSGAVDHDDASSMVSEALLPNNYTVVQIINNFTGVLVNFPMLGHLLITLAVVQVVWARAKPIDIFNDPGEGDILQLRNLKKNGTKVYNALYNNSDLKWILTDEDGNIRIPYTITGPFKPTEEDAIAEAMKRIAKEHLYSIHRTER